jgi:hypothetical protein
MIKDVEKRREYHKKHQRMYRLTPKGVEIERRAKYKFNFGLTLEQYAIMLQKQGGVCAICGEEETATNKAGNIKHLGVDHNHITDKIRGLLCQKCNIGLGNFKIDTMGKINLEKAILYWRKYEDCK